MCLYNIRRADEISVEMKEILKLSEHIHGAIFTSCKEWVDVNSMLKPMRKLPERSIDCVQNVKQEMSSKNDRAGKHKK